MTPPDVNTGAGPEIQRPLPTDALVVVPMRNMVLFPEVVLPVTVGRPSSVAAIQQAVREQRQIVLVLQRDPQNNQPGPDDLYRVGTVANILRYMTSPEGGHHIVCQGVQRFRIGEFVEGYPFLLARGLHLAEPTASGPEIEARFLVLRNQVREVFELLPQAPPELRQTIEATTSPGLMADLAATYLDSEPAEKQGLLETVDLVPRLDQVTKLLAHRLEVLRLSAEIGKQTKASLDTRQREVLLREQMAAIQRELGEEGSNKQELADLEKAIAAAKMPAEVEAVARKELRRLQRTPEAAGEYSMIRTYLDILIELPWALPESKDIDIVEARRILDADHFGLDKIKQRIVEYLAVRKLAPDGKARCVIPLPGLSIATGVSSACSTEHSSRLVFSASTSGCRRTPQTPTHCARVERAMATPARSKMPSWRYSGWWSAYLATRTWASSPAVGMPLSITSAGTGAWISVWQLVQAHLPRMCRST